MLPAVVSWFNLTELFYYASWKDWNQPFGSNSSSKKTLRRLVYLLSFLFWVEISFTLFQLLSFLKRLGSLLNKLLSFNKYVSSPLRITLGFLEVWLQTTTQNLNLWLNSRCCSILSTKVNWPLVLYNFFTSDLLPQQQSLATNPKSPQVHGPPGMPRDTEAFVAVGKALLLVPKDGVHIKGSAGGWRTESKNILCALKNTRNTTEEKCLYCRR